MQPFEAIVVQHGPMVMRICRALVGPFEADDVWSETFLAALRAYPGLPAGSNVRGWLATIAHHKAIDQLRARNRAPEPTAEAGGNLSGAGSEWGPEPPDTELHGALAALPSKQRGAVVYRYLADLAYEEVGALLQCSPTAARRNAADGIASLRRHYGRELR